MAAIQENINDVFAELLQESFAEKSLEMAPKVKRDFLFESYKENLEDKKLSLNVDKYPDRDLYRFEGEDSYGRKAEDLEEVKKQRKKYNEDIDRQIKKTNELYEAGSGAPDAWEDPKVTSGAYSEGETEFLDYDRLPLTTYTGNPKRWESFGDIGRGVGNIATGLVKGFTPYEELESLASGKGDWGDALSLALFSKFKFGKSISKAGKTFKPITTKFKPNPTYKKYSDNITGSPKYTSDLNKLNKVQKNKVSGGIKTDFDAEKLMTGLSDKQISNHLRKVGGSNTYEQLLRDVRAGGMHRQKISNIDEMNWFKRQVSPSAYKQAFSKKDWGKAFRTEATQPLVAKLIKLYGYNEVANLLTVPSMLESVGWKGAGNFEDISAIGNLYDLMGIDYGEKRESKFETPEGEAPVYIDTNELGIQSTTDSLKVAREKEFNVGDILPQKK